MKPFSIYFPQFYATPTNDAAWGAGFTDWVLVATANLHDRWERRAPARGFYDGADPGVHAAQLAEMKAHGLGGLATYHYWFYTHQELPAFEQTLLAARPGSLLPWFLIWASEGWSRRWLGDPTPIATLTREPSPEDIARHCRHLLRCFEHPDYLRWQGKPLYVWYHLDHFARPARVVEQYRECLLRDGVEIAVGHFIKNPFDAQHAACADLSYLFEPRLFFNSLKAGRGSRSKRLFDGIQRVAGEAAAQRLLTLVDRLQGAGKVHTAQDHLAYMRDTRRTDMAAALGTPVQDVVSPGWNNTPRYGSRYTALQSLRPDDFGDLVRAATRREPSIPVLINAWNEWSEGAAIEPCAYHGTRYLDALGDAARPSARADRSATAEDQTA